MGFDVQRHNDVHPIQLAQKSTIPSSNLHFRNSDNINIMYIYTFICLLLGGLPPSRLILLTADCDDCYFVKTTMGNFQGN